MSNTEEVNDWEAGPDNGGVTEEARQWLVYLYSGEADSDGHRNFARWLHQSPAHSEAYAQVEKLWRGLVHAGAAGAFKPVSLTAAESPQPEPARWVLLFAIPKQYKFALAAIVATVGVALPLFTFSTAPATVHFSNAESQVRTISLADGSRVTLGGQSAMDVAYTSDGRAAHLTRGVAYFDIAHDRSKPFTVQMGHTDVRVLGTAFEVRYIPSGARISVTRGGVMVTQRRQSSFNGAESRAVRLVAGQQVTADSDGRLGAPRPFDMNHTLAWRQGQLVFVDTSLAEVSTEVNRYRAVPIVLADDPIRRVRISMVLPAGETDRLLTALEQTYRLKVDRRVDRVIVRQTD